MIYSWHEVTVLLSRGECQRIIPGAQPDLLSSNEPWRRRQRVLDPADSSSDGAMNLLLPIRFGIRPVAQGFVRETNLTSKELQEASARVSHLLQLSYEFALPQKEVQCP